MDKKTFLNDLKLLMKDVTNEGRSVIIREEQEKTKSGLPVKSAYVLKAKSGLNLPGDHRKQK